MLETFVKFYLFENKIQDNWNQKSWHKSHEQTSKNPFSHNCIAHCAVDAFNEPHFWEKTKTIWIIFELDSKLG